MFARNNAYITTFEPERTIQPIFTGGDVALDQSGHLLATCLGEEAVITDLDTGRLLARIDGDGDLITTLLIAPLASHLIICSRSLSMRTYTLSSVEHPSISLDVSLLRTFKPHSTPVITAAIDQTGTLVATGSADGVVKVWDIRGGYVTHTFRGHSGVISALHFFEKSVDSEREPIVGKADRKKRHRPKEDVQISDIVINSNSQNAVIHLASGGEDGKVKVWSLAKQKPEATLDSHVSVVRGICYSDRSKSLVTGSRDKTIILWDPQTWTIIRILPILETVEAVGFLESDDLLYTGGERGIVRIWDPKTGREVVQEQDAESESNNESDGILQILYNIKSDFLLSVRSDQRLVLYSTAGLTKNTTLKDASIALSTLREISGTHDEIIDMAYVTQNRSLLALATNSETIRLVNLTTSSRNQAKSYSATYFGADVASLKGHEDIIICLDVDWSGCWLATGAKDDSARLWSIDHQNGIYRCAAVYTGHAESLGAIALPHLPPLIDSVAYSQPLAHPPSFMITGSQDRTVKFWDLGKSLVQNPNSSPPRARYTRKAHEKDINAISINHSSTLFASASQDRTVKIWSVEEGEVQGVLRGHRRGVWSVRFAPKDTPTITGDTGPASASRGLVLTGSGDKTVKIWSLTDYSCLRTFEGHTNSVLKVLWMPTPEIRDSSNNNPSRRPLQIASASGDGLVKVWDATSGEISCTLDNHIDRVWALTVNPGDGTLVSGGGDSVVTFWRDTTSESIAATAAATTQRVEQEQQLQNYIHGGSYREAIVLALELNHPARLLTLLQNVTATNPPEEGSLSGVKAVDDVLRTLSDGQLLILMQRLGDWNTNARTAVVAQRILGVIVRSYSTARLAGLKGKGWRDVLEALRAYTERHYRTVEELVDESFLVEYTLGEMEEVTTNDVGIGAPRTNGDIDMIMV